MSKFIPFVLLLALWLVPDVTIAQVGPGGFVPCNGFDCSACNLVGMVNTIIIWMFGIIFLIFAYLMVVAGFGLVTSGGNSSALDAAKSKFTNAIIGVVIVMAAWLFVDTIMRQLLTGSGDLGVAGFSGFGPWSEVQCSEQTMTSSWAGDPSSPGAPPATPLPGGPVGTCSGGTCVPIVGVPCKPGIGCNISSGMVPRLTAFHAAAGVSGARITEAMPPTYVHQSKCHTNGTCVDYGKAGGMTAAEITQTANAARANGLRPVYEVKTAAEKTALVAAGARADDISVISAITAPHFSIYGY